MIICILHQLRVFLFNPSLKNMDHTNSFMLYGYDVAHEIATC